MSYFIDGRCLGCGGPPRPTGELVCDTCTPAASHTHNVPGLFKLLSLDERAVLALERIATALETLSSPAVALKIDGSALVGVLQRAHTASAARL